jgi:hypothetical protein
MFAARVDGVSAMIMAGYCRWVQSWQLCQTSSGVAAAPAASQGTTRGVVGVLINEGIPQRRRRQERGAGDSDVATESRRQGQPEGRGVYRVYHSLIALQGI